MDLLRFTKMEATGNDYIYMDFIETPFPGPLSAAEIEYLCHRHFGIGADGLVYILSSDLAYARMLMFNADGSRSAMCGNALRSIALFVARKTGEKDFMIESDVGLHQVFVHSIEESPAQGDIEITLGGPEFQADQVPFLEDQLPIKEVFQNPGHYRLDLPDLGPVEGALISMGNPHLVLFVDDPQKIDLSRVGPVLERHPAFPERINIEFVSFDSESGVLVQRTFERGSGETLSCGSGACATHVAAVLSGRVPHEHQASIQLRGGELQVKWERTSNRIFLRGPARVVYEGVVHPGITLRRK